MKVFINKPIPQAGMQLIKDQKITILTPESDELSRAEWIDFCQKADVILSVGRNDFDKDFFEKCPNVKAIALFSVGFDNVDIKEATKRGIPVGNTPDVLSKATSDVAFLLMQSVARRASFNFEKVKNETWGNFNPMAFLGQELYGKTLGVYGLGRIGYEMALKCKNAFDMKIIYHNRKPNLALEKELGAKFVRFEELIAASDVLTLHANYTKEQNEIFNLSVFEKMKSNAIFINTARGGFHNELDLCKALKSEMIWGAGLDVTNPEPMNPESELLTLSNACVFPHIGSATYEARNGMARCAAENVLAFINNDKMPYAVNNEVYKS